MRIGSVVLFFIGKSTVVCGLSQVTVDDLHLANRAYADRRGDRRSQASCRADFGRLLGNLDCRHWGVLIEVHGRAHLNKFITDRPSKVWGLTRP